MSKKKVSSRNVQQTKMDEHVANFMTKNAPSDNNGESMPDTVSQQPETGSTVGVMLNPDNNRLIIADANNSQRILAIVDLNTVEAPVEIIKVAQAIFKYGESQLKKGTEFLFTI